MGTWERGDIPMKSLLKSMTDQVPPGISSHNDTLSSGTRSLTRYIRSLVSPRQTSIYDVPMGSRYMNQIMSMLNGSVGNVCTS